MRSPPAYLPCRAALALLAASVVSPLACDSPASPRTTTASAPAESSPAHGTASPEKLRIEDAPAVGDVAALVRDALARAERDERRVVVYVGATWCEPCERFHRAAQAGELDAQFPKLDVLAFDVDRDGDRLAPAGYAWDKYVPLFAIPGRDGRASGKRFEGGIKGDGAIAYLAPRLHALLSE